MRLPFFLFLQLCFFASAQAQEEIKKKKEKREPRRVFCAATLKGSLDRLGCSSKTFLPLWSRTDTVERKTGGGSAGVSEHLLTTSSTFLLPFLPPPDIARIFRAAPKRKKETERVAAQPPTPTSAPWWSQKSDGSRIFYRKKKKGRFQYLNDILNSKWSPCWHRTKSWVAFSFHWRRDSTTIQLSSINVQPVKKNMLVCSLHAVCGLAENLPPPRGGKSHADGRKRGGGGGTDVNTDKGWFECASAAKSGGGVEWQKKGEKNGGQWRREGETGVKGAENVTRLQGPGRLGVNEGGTDSQTEGAQREKSI